MKCRECPDYTKCVKESNLAIKRKNCPKAKIEKVKTNADRIRAMSDEELEKLLIEFSAFACIFPDKYCEEISCVECVTKWLQQPADGGESG